MPKEPLPARFAIDKADDRVNLTFAGPAIAAKELPEPDAGSWDALEGLASGVSRELSLVRDFCCASPSLKLEKPVRDAALEKLRSIGLTLLVRILGRYRQTVHILGPGTLAYGVNHPPLTDVEVSCHDSLILPAELLPLLEPQDTTLKDDDPLRVATSMLGFGSACHRPTRSRVPADERLLNSRAVRFYWHASLKGAREQWKWLKDRVDRRGPHPAKGEDSEAIVARIISKENRRAGAPLTSAIEHFHCHHERRDDNVAEEDALKLKASGWTTREVTVRADAVARRSYGQSPQAGLVFLNGCSSQFVSPKAVGAFARELLQNGRSAVVTTWSDVPDDVALAMGTMFYEAFLEAGETVGAALRTARIRLLREWGNPLGLLYTVYGNSRFRLSGVRNSDLWGKA